MTTAPGDKDPTSHQQVALPIQAALVTFVATMVAAPVYVIWSILQGFEVTRPWSWSVPLVGAGLEIIVLRRFVRRASEVGFLITEALPSLTAVLTTIASASLWLSPLLPGLSGPRSPLERNAVGLDVAVPALLTWLGAWLGLALSRRRAGVTRHGDVR